VEISLILSPEKISSQMTTKFIEIIGYIAQSKTSSQLDHTVGFALKRGSYGASEGIHPWIVAGSRRIISIEISNKKA